MISFDSPKSGKSKHPLEVEEQKACWEWLDTLTLDSRGRVISGTANSDINVLKLTTLQTFSYMVPNGVQLGGGRTRRAQYMASLKAQGFKPGVSDMVIAYPIWHDLELGDQPHECLYCGAYIELKRTPESYPGPAARASAVKPDQRDWLELMRSVGYWCAVAYGREDFKSLVNSYLRHESPRPLDFIPGE